MYIPYTYMHVVLLQMWLHSHWYLSKVYVELHGQDCSDMIQLRRSILYSACTVAVQAVLSYLPAQKSIQYLPVMIHWCQRISVYELLHFVFHISTYSVPNFVCMMNDCCTCTTCYCACSLVFKLHAVHFANVIIIWLMTDCFFLWIE